MNPKAIPGPEKIARRRLSNGLLAIVYENHSLPTWVISGLLPGGSIFETRETAGLAAVTAQMLQRGNSRYSFEELNERVESLGASISFGSGRHSLSFYGKSLVEDVDTVLEMLSLSLREPTFPEDQFALLKGQILTVLQERDSDTQSVADMTFDRLVYPENHPYSWPTDGYREVIENLTLEQVRDFHSRCHRPEGGVVAVVGDLSPDEMFERLERAFGDWRGGEDPCPEPDLSVPPLAETVRERVTLPDKMQADLVLGRVALNRNHPDYFPAVVANTVLGRFGMMGRLGERVREQQGLAYYAYSTLEANSAPSPWIAIAGVNPANVDRAVASILEEIERLRTEPVLEEELADSQSFIVGSLPLRLETNASVARALLDIGWYDLGWDYLQRMSERVWAVTPDDVLRVARKYLSSQVYALAIAGPKAE